jgi:hypothetical protein
LDYTQSDNFLSGSRFYLSYSGSAPSPANCITLASDIGTQWAAHLAALVNVGFTLTEVDVLDLNSLSGASGQASPGAAGTRSGQALTASVATNVEFNIARRYRGGKPRMYLPSPEQGDLLNEGAWGTTFIGQVNTGVAAFFAALEALSIGSMGTLQHVNISFYDGVYTTTPPWRGPGFKYPPKYRTTPLVDAVEGYACKAVIGSQRRRRTATTY